MELAARRARHHRHGHRARARGQQPVAEIQFCDYAFNTIDLLKLAGNTCWSSDGDWNLPMVMMTPVGAGIRGSIYHSHSFDAQATRIPGWKIVMPSNAARRVRPDAVARSSIRTR